MKINFKNKFWKIGRWFGLLFILLFIFRLIYGYVAVNTTYSSESTGDFFSSVENLRKNYASEKVSYKATKEQFSGHGFNTTGSAASNQKFEKTASIKSRTSDFEKDESTIKTTTTSYNGVIQYEQNTGLKGNRQIHLLIGISPEKFDVFYAEIQKIGRLLSSEVTKVDKTNDYRQLNATKVSIEKTLVSLKELKSRGGQIADFISLNEKILEVEERLQELGVELGNFDSVNEFCTVKLSLYEGKNTGKISFLHRVKVAFEWSVKYFIIIIFSLLLVSIAILLLLTIIDHFKIIQTIVNKIKEE